MFDIQSSIFIYKNPPFIGEFTKGSSGYNINPEFEFFPSFPPSSGRILAKRITDFDFCNSLILRVENMGIEPMTS